MTLIPFPHRSPTPAGTLASLASMKRSPDPRCDIAVRKGDRERRYQIWTDSPGHWIGEIWYGKAQHFRKRVAGVHDARMLAATFARELRELLADGWMEP